MYLCPVQRKQSERHTFSILVQDISFQDTPHDVSHNGEDPLVGKYMLLGCLQGSPNGGRCARERAEGLTVSCEIAVQQSGAQDKPAHVPPPMTEAVITVPATKLPSAAVHKIEEVAASTPLAGTPLHPFYEPCCLTE